jgi:hypothetical protein
MLAFTVLHFIGGALLGGWFRIAVLLPAFALVALEAAVVAMYPALYPASWPWYAVLVVGIAAVQAGYVVASFFKPRRAEGPEPSTTRPSVSTPE